FSKWCSILLQRESVCKAPWTIKNQQERLPMRLPVYFKGAEYSALFARHEITFCSESVDERRRGYATLRAASKG
ncbi:MAG: hypothetical protein E6559_22085, partial [Pantoea sp.]|nr:hypothetical protein [Pantoea sp.]